MPDTDLTANIPAGWLTYLNTAYIAWFFISRAWKNLRAGGGLYGIKTALLWGDKIPDAKDADDTHRTKVIIQKKGTTTSPFPPTPPEADL